MSTILLYLICAVMLGGAGLIWYFTRGTPQGAKLMPVVIAFVVIAMVAVSCSNKVPLVGTLASWVRDKFADKKIEKLDKDIARLEQERNKGVSEAQGLQRKAEKVLEDAKATRDSLKAMDAVLDKKAGKLKDAIPLKKAAEDMAPPKSSDALSEAISLVKELQRRKLR